MRIAVCDDDRHDQEQVLQALRDVDPDAEAECFSDGASLLDAAKQAPPFDIIFLDIYMPGENGIGIARAIREAYPRTGLVFVTSSEDHALAAFSLYALHYLVKPVTADGVAEAFLRLRALHPELRESLSFTAGRIRQKVYLDEICTLSSDNHAVEITLTNGQRIRAWMTLGELEQKLGRNFLKINRGVIVNMDCIAEMRTNLCILKNGMEFSLAIRERGTICAAYQDYLMDRLAREKGAGL